MLRVDRDAHRPAPDLTPQVEAIREVARAHRKAVRDARHLGIRLRSLLRDYHPAAALAWADLQGGLTRTDARLILAAAPTPQQAARLTPRRLETLLTAAGRSRLITDEATRLHTLFHARSLRQPPAVEAAMGYQTSALLTQLDAVITTAHDLAAHLEPLFERHPHARIYLSFPGLGPTLAPRLLGEIGDDPNRFDCARSLRAFCSATPITWASGTSNRTSFRRNANPILAETGHLWAFAALTRSPGARELYDRRRAAGDRHAAALRRLYARLLGSLHHCLRHDTPYNETRAFRHVHASAGEP